MNKPIPGLNNSPKNASRGVYIKTGATVPPDLMVRLEKVQDDPESICQIGIDHATNQCEKLLMQRAPGIHFYTLNRSRATLSVLEGLV